MVILHHREYFVSVVYIHYYEIKLENGSKEIVAGRTYLLTALSFFFIICHRLLIFLLASL